MSRIVLPIAFLAAACAAQPEPYIAACDRDWREVGWVDGANGAPAARLRGHAQACARAGGALSRADRAAWRAGWREARGEEVSEPIAEAPPRERPRVYPRGQIGVGTGGVFGGVGFGVDLGSLTVGFGWGF